MKRKMMTSKPSKLVRAKGWDHLMGWIFCTSLISIMKAFYCFISSIIGTAGCPRWPHKQVPKILVWVVLSLSISL